MFTTGEGQQFGVIGALLDSRIDELAARVVAAVRIQVDFYRDSPVVSDDELLQSATDNLHRVFRALTDDTEFDTSVSATVGRLRAAAGVPLTAVTSAYRVAAHHCWQATTELVSARPDISSSSLLSATARMWEAQDHYTVAMIDAYHQRAQQLMLDNAAEMAALTEALLDGKPLAEHSLWDVAQLLQIPSRGPYVVIAAAAPRVGRQALPGIKGTLHNAGIYSSWHLLPDTQIGIAHIPPPDGMDQLLDILGQQATCRVGISPPFQSLTDTANSARYARITMNAQPADGTAIATFTESVLGVAAVSAPEVTRKLAEVILGPFAELPHAEQQTLRSTFAAWLDCQGSLTDAASALFCHPNTVRNRLHRIEERTGRSVTIPRELAELCLAFEVARNLPAATDS